MLALLVAQHRRLDLAEDGLGDAFEAAARTWPRDGVPGNPAGWLLTTARRRIIDRLRTESVAHRVLPVLAVEADLREQAERTMADPGTGPDPGTGAGARAGPPGGGIGDERLRLVLLCAHPSLAPESAAALTLRLVLGVPTEDIARLFLVSRPTMAARLTRARKRLAGASFDVPSGAALEERVGVVGDVAYLAFTAGYAPGSGDDVLRAEVAGEAVRLVQVLRSVLPAPSAPVDVLLALMTLQHARRDARVSPDGDLVLLPDQDRTRWHHDEIAVALDLLAPHLDDPPTPRLLEALVAAEHAVAPTAASTNWPRIAGWYAELETLTGSPVVRLNRAVAVAEADGPLAGLALLDGLDLPGHRLPAVRAELLARSGATEESRPWFARALALCANTAERAHLSRRLAEVGGHTG